MKKVFFLFIFSFVLHLNAQVINFPDTVLRSRLVAANPSSYTAFNFNDAPVKVDTNNDGQIQVSEALLIKKLSLRSQSFNISFPHITDLTGMDFFTNLEILDINTNYISTINLSLPNLKELLCGVNMLTSLNLSNLVSLEKIDYSYNTQLPPVNFSGLNNVKHVICTNNQLSSIANLSSLSNLQSLECSYNNFTELDLTLFIHLESLECYNNQLTSLNLSGLNLKRLNYSNNTQVPLIDFTQFPNLEYLECSNNALQNIVNVSNCPNLRYLSCNNLQLTTLDLSNCSDLQWIYCTNNLLTTLELNHLTDLIVLSCSNNQLNTLFLKGFTNPILGISDIFFDGNPNLNYICCNESQIDYFQYRINGYGYTNCFANTYCTFTPAGNYYVIEGNEKLDSNQNGCDLLDISVPNLKFNINDTFSNSTTISNLSGAYSLPLAAGDYTITPILENPNYFTILPTSFDAQFPADPSPFIQDFCVSVNGVHPDLEVILSPNSASRPGNDAQYRIYYKNKGNQIQSGSIQLSFDDSTADLVSSTPAVSNQIANQLSWDFNNLQPFEMRQINLTINLNSPTEIPPLNSGDVLSYTVTIDGGADELPVDNTFSLNQTVSNSYDPNDKTCLEGATIELDKVGEFVHYLIRFENTGTANAGNIVVKDLIDTTKFDVATLIPIDGSHEFYTRITNTNQVEFIFENIQLPFDDDNNDGFVIFKIKTKSTLTAGSSFSNTASIYFDYNFPIVTNTATTTIQALVNQDFDFSNYFELAPNPTKDILNIHTKNDIELSSISIYNALGQLVVVIPNAKETTSIDVSNLTSGTYFIKVMSDKGSSNSKFIKQ